MALLFTRRPLCTGPLTLVCSCVGLARRLGSNGHLFPALVEDAGLDPRTQVMVRAHNTL